MVDGSDSVTKRDWPLVLQWTNNLLNQIAPAEREYSSTAILQQFSKDPITGQIPDAIEGQFVPGDQESVNDFNEQIKQVKQSAQGTNTYESFNKIFGNNGLYYSLPTGLDRYFDFSHEKIKES